MNLIYYDLYQATRLEKFVTAYGQFLKANGEQPVTWKRASSMDEVLQEADVISLHPILDKTTYHLVNKERLSMMKKEAILVNCSRGAVVDEVALVEHLKENLMFRFGLDVFEDEPYMKPRLADMKNAIVVPHIASSSKWTREGMATLAALNVLGKRGIEKLPFQLPDFIAATGIEKIRQCMQHFKLWILCLSGFKVFSPDGSSYSGI